MKKIIYVIVFFTTFISNVCSLTSEYDDRINYIFANVDKNKVNEI
ncbi:hypothetical protein Barb6_02204 [Bacteroidales bacterium Barb6]|nr:hypothetical protein Barb6_02204 [Bacteroidales bacterium Barb6]